MTETNAPRLMSLNGLELLPRSVVVVDDVEVGMAKDGTDFRLTALAPPGSPVLAGFEGERSAHGGRRLLVGPTSAVNLEALRALLPWLNPRVLGLRTSAGFGDRLGLATPGHARALRAAGGDIAPIFAQQSIREMERTGRGPREIMDDAAWGVFAEGWREGFGADADHLKTFEDVDACVVAGYTFFTFDPGDHVDDRAETADSSTLQALLRELPWDELEDTPLDFARRYTTARFAPEGHEITVDEETIARAAVKYGRAVARAVDLYRHLELRMGEAPFEVEVSVDETESPTTHVQHLYIAGELSRLGVRFVSLAPRYVGRFEKGVDYLGDVGDFESDIAVHAAIARDGPAGEPYKLSLHSGSDKFSIYEAVVRQTRGLAHLKTAGTSYLEALRTIAAVEPPLMRGIYAFSRERYEEDRASYHLSAELGRCVDPSHIADAELPLLLDRFDEREVLHVTFGSVLKNPELRARLMDTLLAHPEEYALALEKHFARHLTPFARAEHRRNGGTA